MSICVRKTLPFANWVKTKMSISDFRVLSQKNKKELFLRWKHGFTNAESNDACETTDSYIMARISDLPKETWDKMKLGMKKYYELRLTFQNMCNETWKDVVAGRIW